ncbi:MAG: hypothetical protein WC971_04160 [Coriobacteriia bacterium]
MFPPMLLYLRAGKPESQRVGLWLPLFLVWLILLPIVLFVLALTILADVVLYLVGERYHHYTLLLLGCFGVLAATRGMTVRVYSSENVVDIDLV